MALKKLNISRKAGRIEVLNKLQNNLKKTGKSIGWPSGNKSLTYTL
jgi:hypothetical protein